MVAHRGCRVVIHATARTRIRHRLVLLVATTAATLGLLSGCGVRVRDGADRNERRSPPANDASVTGGGVSQGNGPSDTDGGGGPSAATTPASPSKEAFCDKAREYDVPPDGLLVDDRGRAKLEELAKLAPPEVRGDVERVADILYPQDGSVDMGGGAEDMDAVLSLGRYLRNECRIR